MASMCNSGNAFLVDRNSLEDFVLIHNFKQFARRRILSLLKDFHQITSVKIESFFVKSPTLIEFFFQKKIETSIMKFPSVIFNKDAGRIYAYLQTLNFCFCLDLINKR